MWKDLFTNGDFMALPQITLIVFIVVFLGVVLWTLSKRRKPHYDRMSQMPLDDTVPFENKTLETKSLETREEGR